MQKSAPIGPSASRQIGCEYVSMRVIRPPDPSAPLPGPARARRLHRRHPRPRPGRLPGPHQPQPLRPRRLLLPLARLRLRLREPPLLRHRLHQRPRPTPPQRPPHRPPHPRHPLRGRQRLRRPQARAMRLPLQRRLPKLGRRLHGPALRPARSPSPPAPFAWGARPPRAPHRRPAAPTHFSTFSGFFLHPSRSPRAGASPPDVLQRATAAIVSARPLVPPERKAPPSASSHAVHCRGGFQP